MIDSRTTQNQPVAKVEPFKSNKCFLGTVFERGVL